MKVQNRQNGQALLLILLSVGVIVTVALSVVSKSVSDITITQKDEQSLRAFSAAEAGVEDALKVQLSTLPTQTGTIKSDQNIGNTGQFTSTAQGFPLDTTQYSYPVEMVSGDTGTIWFSSHLASYKLSCSGSSNPCYSAPTVDLCWGKVGIPLNSQPAIAAGVVYEDIVPAPIRYSVATFDPVASRRAADNFGSNVTTDVNNGACTINNVKYANRATISFAGIGIPPTVPTLKLLKGMIVRVFFNSETTIIGAKAAAGYNFPLQGRIIESTGESGNASRKIKVYAIYPEIPNIFQAVIYSPPGVVKTP